MLRLVPCSMDYLTGFQVGKVVVERRYPANHKGYLTVFFHTHGSEEFPMEFPHFPWVYLDRKFRSQKLLRKKVWPHSVTEKLWNTNSGETNAT